MRYNKCICYSGDLIFYFDKKIESNLYPIYKCKICKYGFVFPYPSDKDLIEFYDDHDDYRKLTINKIIEEENFFPNSILDAKRICTSLTVLNCSSKL